jgi:hypothetical protein
VTGPRRDWDKEMAEIDKIIAKQPVPVAGKPVPAAGGAPAPSSPARQGAAPLPAARGRTALTGWVRVLLGVAVAIGVAQWPYAHACGFPLYGYLAAAGGVVLAGLWGAVTSWRRRMTMAHVLSLVVTLWGGVLVGKALLDRSNYARHPATWACP